jgi:hypothetical protein
MGCCIRRIDLISTHGKRQHGPMDGLRTFASGIFSVAFDYAD